MSINGDESPLPNDSIMRRKSTQGAKTYIRRLEAFARCRGAEVSWGGRLPGVFGRIDQGRIALREGLSAEQSLQTLVHELTHLLVHCHASPRVDRTVCEYEAEAVERWVMAALEADQAPGSERCSSFTEDLLATSVERVRHAATVLIHAALKAPQVRRAAIGSEPQTAVQIDTATGEEVVLNDELYRVRDLIGLAKPL